MEIVDVDNLNNSTIVLQHLLSFFAFALFKVVRPTTTVIYACHRFVLRNPRRTESRLEEGEVI